jgi:hypothetical protein
MDFKSCGITGLVAGLELRSNSTNTENVTLSQMDHVHMQGITNEGQYQKSVIRL